MTRKFSPMVFVYLSVFLALMGCADDTLDFAEFGSTEIQPCDPETRATSRSFDTDWENITEITLSDGTPLRLPWHDEATSSHTSEFLKDMRKCDGWVLVRHNLYEKLDIKNWKIVLYNQASGDLKVYTYFDKVSSEHNTAIWEVKFSNPQGWFNGLCEVAVPSTKKLTSSFVWKTSVQPKESHSFLSLGWNVILVPGLTYDPTAPSSNILDLDSYATTTTLLTAFGQTTGSIEGKILSYGGNSNNIETTIASYVGNGAENWVKSNVKDGASVIAKGIGGLIKAGVHKILGTLFGWASKPSYTEKDVRLSLKADTKFNASLVTLQGTGAPGSKVLIDKNKTGFDLGNWNLTDNPTIYMHPVGVIYNGAVTPTIYEARYAYVASGRFKADIVINPQLQKHIKSYKVECVPVRYVPVKDLNYLPQLPESFRKSFDYGGIGNLLPSTSFQGIQSNDEKVYSCGDYTIYDNKMQGTAYYWKIWDKYGKPSGSVPAYKYIYGPSNNDICRGGDLKLDCTYNYVRVLVTMEVEFEGKSGTVVTSRTYRPKFEWDPTEVKRYSSESMQKLQAYAATDDLLRTIDNGFFSQLEKSASNFTNALESSELSIQGKVKVTNK